MLRKSLLSLNLCVLCGFGLVSCANSSGHGNLVQTFTTGPRLAKFPTVAERDEAIKNEKFGDYFIGRRYFVKRTSFWGYLRKPGQSWNSSRLVMMNEDSLLSPDRIPETGPGDNHGFDQNFEYKIWGNFTGETVYDPNSNNHLPEFQLRKYELISRTPGWIFSPDDQYDKDVITLRRR